MKPDAPAPKKPQPKKVFDVMKPGKALANPSARPIIVGHKPKVQDSVSGVSGVGERALSHGKHKIELTHHEEPEEKKEAPVAPMAKTPESTKEPAPKPSAPAVVAVAASTMHAEDPAAPSAAKPESAPEADNSMKPIFDTPPGETDTPPPAPDTAIAFDDTPAPVPDQEQIVVSHHGPLDEPFKVIGLLLLIIILAAVALNILIDADVLKVDGVPHTNFFK